MQKKKIIIFSIKGGFGHVSASNALVEALKDTYDVSVRYLFEDALPELDFIAKITGKKLSFVTIYNNCIPYWWCIPLLKLFGYFGHILFFFQKKQAFSRFLALLSEENPDCVISVMGIFNDMILKSVKELDIPFLLIPTDIDARWYFIQNLAPYLFPKFYLCLMFFDDYVQKQLSDFKIPLSYVHIIGPIVRSDFFEEKNIPALKQGHLVPDNKPVIMIMMGGHGSTKLVSYTKTLAHFPLPIHLLLCIGKNNYIINDLSHISFDAQVTYSIIPFTQKISDFMAMSDVVITKSGTLSVFEGLVMQKPLFLDATSSVLVWEQHNHQLVEKRFGYSIKRLSNVSKKLYYFLTHKELQETIKKEYQTLEKNNGTNMIAQLLKDMI